MVFGGDVMVTLAEVEVTEVVTLRNAITEVFPFHDNLATFFFLLLHLFHFCLDFTWNLLMGFLIGLRLGSDCFQNYQW